jgi:hypothetical protein
VTQEIYRGLPATIHTETLHKDQNLNSQTGLVGSCSLWIEQLELKLPRRTKEEKAVTDATRREPETVAAKETEGQSGLNVRLTGAWKNPDESPCCNRRTKTP